MIEKPGMIPEELVHTIAEKGNVVLLTHVHPDGDALGSCLGLAQYLKIKGHQAAIIAPNSFPTFYDWMPEVSDIILHSVNPDKAKVALENVDVIFYLDYNDLIRIGDLRSLVENHEAKFVMIDHHRQPTDFADIMFSNPEKSSTSEMVFDVISGLGDENGTFFFIPKDY